MVENSELGFEKDWQLVECRSVSSSTHRTLQPHRTGSPVFKWTRQGSSVTYTSTVVITYIHEVILGVVVIVRVPETSATHPVYMPNTMVKNAVQTYVRDLKVVSESDITITYHCLCTVQRSTYLTPSPRSSPMTTCTTNLQRSNSNTEVRLLECTCIMVVNYCYQTF